MMDVDIVFDAHTLDSAMRYLAPALYDEAIESAVIDLAHFAEARIKERTPDDTGHARRSTRTNLGKATRGAESEAVVNLKYPYASWLETGRDSRGRVMKVRAGGYRMVELAHAEAEVEMPAILDRAGREIAKRWSE